MKYWKSIKSFIPSVSVELLHLPYIQWLYSNKLLLFSYISIVSSIPIILIESKSTGVGIFDTVSMIWMKLNIDEEFIGKIPASSTYLL